MLDGVGRIGRLSSQGALCTLAQTTVEVAPPGVNLDEEAISQEWKGTQGHLGSIKFTSKERQEAKIVVEKPPKIKDDPGGMNVEPTEDSLGFSH